MAIRAFPRRGAGDSPVRSRLFCFPYAGAGAVVFSRWPELLPDDLEVCVPSFPGRDTPISTPAIASMDLLVESIAADMANRLDLPFALYGHSMGAFFAFELARKLAGLGQAPAHLFVAAQRAPTLSYARLPIFHLPDSQFLAAVVERYRNIPQSLLDNRELMALLLPTLRADFALSEDYRYRAADPLHCPITALGGIDDPEIRRDQLDAWSVETTGPFAVQLLTGGHFFLQDSGIELLTLMPTALDA